MAQPSINSSEISPSITTSRSLFSFNLAMSLTSFEEKSQTQIDAVINQLAGTNSSLAACSLVSRRWHERCRQQSFRRARLADLDDLRSSGWSPSLDGIADFYILIPASLRE